MSPFFFSAGKSTAIPQQRGLVVALRIGWSNRPSSWQRVRPMALPIKDESGNFLFGFRWGGKPSSRSLDTREPAVADAAVARVDETLTVTSH